MLRILEKEGSVAVVPSAEVIATIQARTATQHLKSTTVHNDTTQHNTLSERPSRRVVRPQDKYAQKVHFAKHGVPLADSRALTDAASARANRPLFSSLLRLSLLVTCPLLRASASAAAAFLAVETGGLLLLRLSAAGGPGSLAASPLASPPPAAA